MAVCSTTALIRLVAALLSSSGAAATEPAIVVSPEAVAQAAPAMLVAPSMPTWACDLGQDTSLWTAGQRAWCCANKDVGCPSAASPKTTSREAEGPATATEEPAIIATEEPAITTEALAATSETETETSTSTEAATTTRDQTAILLPLHSPASTSTVMRTRTDTTTTLETTSTTLTTTSTRMRTDTTTTLEMTSTTLTTTSTTRPSTCHEHCAINGMLATCRDQILQSSLSDFLGNVDSCGLAHEAVTGQCSVCGDCPLEEIACGMLDYDTTPAPVTRPPHGEPCEAVCSFGGQPASCQARIAWSVEHTFNEQPEACQKAHKLVLRQCPICDGCQVSHAKCEGEGSSASAQDEGRVFDCSHGAAVEWNGAKRDWCCEHHQKGCASGEASHLHFQKKVQLLTVGGYKVKVAPSAAVVFVASAALLALVSVVVVRQQGGSDDETRWIEDRILEECEE